MRSGAGRVYATLGRRAEALRVAAELAQQSQERYVRPERIGAIYLNLGDPDATFDWLEKAYRARSSGLAYLKADPRWDPIRADPRFAPLVRKVGIP